MKVISRIIEYHARVLAANWDETYLCYLRKDGIMEKTICYSCNKIINRDEAHHYDDLVDYCSINCIVVDKL